MEDMYHIKEHRDKRCNTQRDLKHTYSLIAEVMYIKDTLRDQKKKMFGELVCITLDNDPLMICRPKQWFECYNSILEHVITYKK